MFVYFECVCVPCTCGMVVLFFVCVRVCVSCASYCVCFVLSGVFVCVLVRL